MSAHPERQAWFPQMPPIQPGETPEHYMERLSNEVTTPYDHHRWPHCRAGQHGDCDFPELAEFVPPTDPRCECPCHADQTVELLGHAAEVIHNKGGVVGVHFDTERGNWMAAVEYEGKEYGGTGPTPTVALLATYDELGWAE